MKLLRLILLLLVLTIVNIAQGESQIVSGSFDVDFTKPEIVEFCDVMQAPNKYVGKPIRVTALYEPLITMESILGFECESKKAAISVGFLDGQIEKSLQEAYTTIGKPNRDPLNISVVGRVISPQMTESQNGYGHYGWSKYLFEIHTFKKLESLEK